MNVLTPTSPEAIILKSLKEGLSYSEYRELLHQLVEENSTSGNEQTEALVNYTLLNDRRMKRWDKTVKISDDNRAFLKDFNQKITLLIITESWCGDAAHVLPVIKKVAELSPNIDIKIVFRDEHEALMNQFLTNGSKSIPKIILVDDLTGAVKDTYGPRPSLATKLVEDYKKEHGKLTPEFKEDLQHWYNKDKGQTTQNDLIKKLKSF